MIPQNVNKIFWPFCLPETALFSLSCVCPSITSLSSSQSQSDLTLNPIPEPQSESFPLLHPTFDGQHRLELDSVLGSHIRSVQFG
jgi:hypothetical protein